MCINVYAGTCVDAGIESQDRDEHWTELLVAVCILVQLKSVRKLYFITLFFSHFYGHSCSADKEVSPMLGEELLQLVILLTSCGLMMFHVPLFPCVSTNV